MKHNEEKHNEELLETMYKAILTDICMPKKKAQKKKAKTKKRAGLKPMGQRFESYGDLKVGDEVKITSKANYGHKWKIGRIGIVKGIYEGGKEAFNDVIDNIPFVVYAMPVGAFFALVFCEGSNVKYQFIDLRDLKKELKIKRTPLWKTLVLPTGHLEAIEEALTQDHEEARELIYSKWGFGTILEKGTGISMLFYGPPGTGKTITAEAIAERLNKPLLIVGAAEVQSAEPGGTERAIKQYFNEAKNNNKVLLFDECDSLIYERGRVGMILGSHINCLLSELERFPGVVIFTTNNTPCLDKAMERRIILKLEFPEPTKEMALKLWQRMIPKPEILDEEVNLEHFSKFKITGGNIKNIVLNAARRAAYKKREKITMEDFEIAFQREAEGKAAFEKNARNIFSEQSLGIEMNTSKLDIKRGGDHAH